MFEKGNFVVYGNTGICEIKDITTMDMDGIPKDRTYYVLEPFHQAGSRIFTPVENPKMKMRRIMTKEEALALIDEIPGIEELWIADEKQREQTYKECIRTCECREWIKIIKTLYLRKEERVSQGKKITATDERYLQIAEENLYNELSIPLGIPCEEMEAYITARIVELEESQV